MSKKSIGLVVLIVLIGIGFWVYASSAHRPAQQIQQKTVNSLVGKWVSATAGKGMQASGKFTISKSTALIDLSGDVTLVIEQIQDNVASGTLAYSNVCSKVIVTTPGKSPYSRSPQCFSVDNIPVSSQIKGNSINFEGTTNAGGKVTFSGVYSNDTLSGTFSRDSQYGQLNGTFSLHRQ